MPLHDFRCPAGHVTEALVDHGVDWIPCPKCVECTPECQAKHRPGYDVLHIGHRADKVFLVPPFARGDLPGYNSPVTGEWIEGRAARRNDLARHDCVPWEAGMREENARRRADRERKLDKAIDETVEAQIINMPIRKREKLAEELRAGVSADVIRLTPT